MNFLQTFSSWNTSSSVLVERTIVSSCFQLFVNIDRLVSENDDTSLSSKKRSLVDFREL